MGEAKRRRDQGYIQSRGAEHYRGHLIVKSVERENDVLFWRVDVLPIAMPDAEPSFTVRVAIEQASLEKVVRECQKVIGIIIHEGTAIPATTVPIDYMKGEALDRFIAKSSTGKHAVCERHWREVKQAAMLGQLSIPIFNIALLRAFTAKMYSDGTLLEPVGITGGFTMNMLWDSYAPICCWLGNAAVNKLITDSNPSLLLERARQNGIL